MAESSLSPKSASPRELNRSYSAEERTGVGTASSMAARDRPPSLAGIGHAPLEILELRVLDECRGGQVEEPGGDDAAASPQLGDVGQIEVVLAVLGIAQRCRLGVDGMALLADVGGAQMPSPSA